jgi:hypothetical protein
VRQDVGIGLARLKSSPLLEAEMVPECMACARLSAADGHSSIACSSAAVFTTNRCHRRVGLTRFRGRIETWR